MLILIISAISLKWVGIMQGSETGYSLKKTRPLLLVRFFTLIITFFMSLIRGIYHVLSPKDAQSHLLMIPIYCRIERSPNGQQNAHRFVPPRRNKGGRNTW